MKEFKKFKFIYKQTVTWGDQDAFGHVNNVQVVRYFENARAEYFTVNKIWEDFGNKIKKGMVITNLNINYRKQIKYPAELKIYLGITEISSRKFTVECSMVDKEEVSVTGLAELIWFDFESAKPTLLPDNIKELKE
jgi:acyl-CoA thioester hydrolase